MSKVCEVCGKHPVAGRSISHSHRVSNRMFRPNIQKITIRDAKGHVRRANVCTSCMKPASRAFRVLPAKIPRKARLAGFFRLGPRFVDYARRSTAGNLRAIFHALYFSR